MGDDGIGAQNNTRVVITNFSGGSIVAARHGITGGASDNLTGFLTTGTNQGNASITGNDGTGLNLDGFNAKQKATSVNAGTITGNGAAGDGDGSDDGSGGKSPATG